MIGVQQIDRVVEVVEEALKGKSHVFYSTLIVFYKHNVLKGSGQCEVYA